MQECLTLRCRFSHPDTKYGALTCLWIYSCERPDIPLTSKNHKGLWEAHYRWYLASFSSCQTTTKSGTKENFQYLFPIFSFTFVLFRTREVAKLCLTLDLTRVSGRFNQTNWSWDSTYPDSYYGKYFPLISDHNEIMIKGCICKQMYMLGLDPLINLPSLLPPDRQFLSTSESPMHDDPCFTCYPLTFRASQQGKLYSSLRRNERELFFFPIKVIQRTDCSKGFAHGKAGKNYC